MNKTELVAQIAESADLTKKAAGDALQGFMMAVADAMKRGDKLQLIGFGTFSTSERSSRTCINPQSGKEMTVPAKTVVKFKVGNKLAEAVK